MGFLKSKRKVSLVLGGGGARGLVHIGVINALLKKGYIIDEIVGCSIGALVGAAFAQGKLTELQNWMSSVTKMQVFKLMDFNNPMLGLLKGTKVLDSLKEVFDDVMIEELPISYKAIATDLKSEKEVVFSSGFLYSAIRASIAIPAVFTGVDVDNQYLVDGGVLNPLPINHVSRPRRNIVIAVNLDGTPASEFGLLTANKKMGSFTALQEAYFAMRRRLSMLTVAVCQPDYVIHVPHNISGIWDYHRSAFLVEKGEEYVNTCIPDSAFGRRKKKAIPTLTYNSNL